MKYLLGCRGADARYLEIGVQAEEQNFAAVESRHKVGVDCDPVTTFRGTSDEFFAQNGDKFDLVFIDGLHTEAQVSRDIEHARGCLSSGGVIVLHDCMPPDAWHQRDAQEYVPGENWNGTVWKAALREFNRTTHRSFVVDTDWGCGVIDTARTQTPRRRELPERLEYEPHYPWLLEYAISVSAFRRQQIAVFYHLACMGPWRGVFEEQMQTLASAGLTTITLTVLGARPELAEALAICRDLGISVQVAFHSPDLTYFERPALQAIEAHARESHGYVLYLHSKGVSNPDDVTKARWRRLMMRELVERWEPCVSELPRYDLVGVNWREMPPISHFNGNFWYASTGYLRTLADFRAYDDRFRAWDPVGPRRLSSEFWIGSAAQAPRVLSLACRNQDLGDPEYWGRGEDA